VVWCVRARALGWSVSSKDLPKAMARYNFYLCVKCKRPYFGGMCCCCVNDGCTAARLLSCRRALTHARRVMRERALACHRDMHWPRTIAIMRLRSFDGRVSTFAS